MAAAADRMTHYSLEQWCDFVRAVTAPDIDIDMKAHLESGCRPCSDVERLWRDILTTAQPDRSKPRDSAVRFVKAAFAQKHRPDAPRTSNFARKIFDNVLEPTPVGLRASMAPMASRVRQLAYDAAPYLLDIRLEQEQGSPQVHLVGQIVYSSGIGALLKDLPVSLMRGTETLQETVTNPFGEFHFQYQPDRDVLLAVRIGPRESICLSLPDFNSPAPGACA